MAAGLTDHPWILRDLLDYRVPPPAWSLPSGAAPLKRLQPPRCYGQPDPGSVWSYLNPVAPQGTVVGQSRLRNAA